MVEVIARDEIVAFTDLPVGLERSSQLPVLVVRIVDQHHGHAVHIHGIDHVFFTFLPEGVQPDAGQIIREIFCFREEIDLVPLPFREFDGEVFIAGFHAARAQSAVEHVHSAADAEPIAEIVTEKETAFLLTKGAVRHVAFGRFQGAVIFIGTVGAVTETARAPEQSEVGGKAVGGTVVACSRFPLYGFVPSLFGDDVDHAAQGLGAIEHGSRAFYHFDPFNH